MSNVSVGRFAFVLSCAVGAIPICGHAQALPGGWYADIAAGEGKAHGSEVDSGTKSDRVWTARIGTRLSPYVAVDAGYEDLGKHDLHVSISRLGHTMQAKSWGASLVAIAPFDAFDVYGRIGYARTESREHFFMLPAQSVDLITHRNEAFYGVGGRYNYGRLGVFAEWNKHDKADIDYWMVGVQLRF